MKIKKHPIKNFNKPFFIAEIGINHNGSLSIAKKLIDHAKSAGADAVKFQSFKKKSLMIEKLYKNKKPDFKFDNRIKSLEDIIDRITLSYKDQEELSNYCKKKKIIFASTPLDLESVDFLHSLKVPFFKVASMDLNHHLLLKKISSKGKPIVLSTGFSSISEIRDAIKVIKKENTKTRVSLLHCISAYPPEDKNINLHNITSLHNKFKIPIGFSDHTIGVSASLGAISNGAAIIEKHFTLNKNLLGWDHKISANPEELEIIIKEGLRINIMLGKKERVISKRENKFKINMRRSIIVNKFIKKDRLIKIDDINFKRPGTGISPSEYNKLVNKKRATKNLFTDSILKKTDYR